jgi:hypothetical protein
MQQYYTMPYSYMWDSGDTGKWELIKMQITPSRDKLCGTADLRNCSKQFSKSNNSPNQAT